MITAKEAYNKYGINRQTLILWRLKGRIEYKAEVINGRYVYFYNEDTIAKNYKPKNKKSK